MPHTKAQIERRLNDLREPTAKNLQRDSSDEANRFLAAMVDCGYHRRCRSRVCPVCTSMANLKRFDSVAIQIRTFGDEVDFVSFVVTVPDVPIQHLRETLNTMAAKLSRQIERRKYLIRGAFVAYESIPAPAAESGSERLDLEHPHAHVLLAVPKGQAGSRHLEVFEGYAEHNVITAGRAIAAAYYNCKASVFGPFTKNWQASLEHNFIERASQLSGFHRYRTTGIFKDRELPAHLQKSLEEIGAELNATEVPPTDSTIPPITTEQEHPNMRSSYYPAPTPGQNLNGFIIVAEAGHDPAGRLQVQVTCHCGRPFRTRWDRVRRGEARSCGCSRLEMRHKLRKARQRRDIAAATAGLDTCVTTLSVAADKSDRTWNAL